VAVSAGDIQARATLDNAEFLKAMRDMANAAAEQTSAIAKQIDKVSGAFDKITDAVGKIAALSGVTEFAKSFVDAAVSVGKLEAAFNNIAGPTAETAAAFAKIKDLQFTSMYDFEQTLGPASKQLLEVGVSASQTAETMAALVDAAAGMKETPEWINAVTGTLTTMSGKMVASEKDMRALQAEGIDAWHALAVYMDTSVGEAQAQVKAHLISSQTVVKAVTAQMEQDWGGMAANSMDSWKGAMHILDESTKEAQVAIGQTIIAVLNQLTPAIEAVSHALKEMSDWWNSLGSGTREAIIIFTAVAGGIIAVTVAISTLLPLVGTLGATFAALVMGSNPAGWIALVVGALAVLGKWVYDEWPAIKAAILAFFDGVQEHWKPVIDFITNLFSPLIAVWKAEWDFLAGIVQTAAEMIWTVISGTGKVVSDFWNWLSGLFHKIPGMDAIIGETTAAWNTSKQAMDAARAADDAKKKSEQEHLTTMAQTRIAAKQQAADDIASANAAKEADKAAKQRAADAKQAAADAQKYADDLRKGYDALAAVSPELAGSFAEAMGGISDDTSKVAKTFGVVWDDMTQSMKDAATQAFATADAFKTLGVTSGASLADAADKADQAYLTIAGDSKSTAQDVENATAAQQAAWQKYNDYLNQDAVAAIHAFGLKTADELQKSQDDWSKYANKVIEIYGEGSKQALDAQVKAIEEYQKNLEASGKNLSDAELAYLAELKQRAADAVDPVTKLANAYKALGVTTIKTQLDQMADLAKAFDTVNKSGTAAQADIYAAQKKLTEATQQHVDYLNQEWKDAYSRGEITATQMYQHEVENARAYLQQLTIMGDGGAASIAEIDAATKVYDQTLKNLQKSTLLDTQTAFHDLGVKSADELKTMADKAEADYQRIVDAAGTDSEQAKTAWINKTKAAYDQILLDGGTLTEKQKAELDKAQQQLDDHLKDTQSAWKTAYDSISSTLNTTFDDLTKTLVTGDGSFGDIMKNLWQGIAEAALNAFINPLKKAITDFVSKELASLISSLTGDGGVLGGLKQIGSAISGIFKSGGGAAASGVEGAATSGAEAAAGGAAEAGGGAASAVSGAGSAVSSVTGIVGAVGAVGTMVSSIIGNFQQAKMETTMNAVEHNTRYTALYVGDRSDGGILGQMFRVASDLEFGPIVKILEQHRDNFFDWTGVITPIASAIQANLVDISSHTFTQIQLLEQIRDSIGALEGSIDTGFKSLQVNIQAQGITTAEAARALGNQIARNLQGQMAVTVS
jgi:hypothetical protein